MNTFYTKKYRHINKISDVLINSLNKVYAKNGIKDIKLVSRWKDIMGEELAKLCYPEKIYNKNGKKTLYITGDNLFIKSNIIYYKKDMIDKINRYFGKEYVNDIKTLNSQ